MIRLFLFFSILSLGMVAYAQDEDPPAPTLKEAKAAFDRANRDLNAVWAGLKSELPEDEFSAVQTDQRNWLEYRDQSARMMSGAEPDSADYLSYAAELTTERTAYLNGLIDQNIDNLSLTGVWGDGYGGSLKIVQNEDGVLYFSCNVVRGPTLHLGEIAGIGVWNDPLGWFSDEGTDETREDVSNLAFVLRGRKLEVIGANTHYYHGARAYFDGQYVKTKTLTDKEQKEVIKLAEAGGEEG